MTLNNIIKIHSLLVWTIALYSQVLILKMTACATKHIFKLLSMKKLNNNLMQFLILEYLTGLYACMNFHHWTKHSLLTHMLSIYDPILTVYIFGRLKIWLGIIFWSVLIHTEKMKDGKFSLRSANSNVTSKSEKVT